MTISPKIVELDKKEKETLLAALKVLNEFESKTAYQLEFEDEHNICWNAKESIEDFLRDICDIE